MEADAKHLIASRLAGYRLEFSELPALDVINVVQQVKLTLPRLARLHATRVRAKSRIFRSEMLQVAVKLANKRFDFLDPFSASECHVARNPETEMPNHGRAGDRQGGLATPAAHEDGIGGMECELLLPRIAWGGSRLIGHARVPCHE